MKNIDVTFYTHTMALAHLRVYPFVFLATSFLAYNMSANVSFTYIFLQYLKEIWFKQITLSLPGTVLSKTQPTKPPTNIAVLNNTVNTLSASSLPGDKRRDVNIKNSISVTPGLPCNFIRPVTFRHHLTHSFYSQKARIFTNN